MVETARTAAPKLAIPVFFLVILLVIFAGIYFAVETQIDCHVAQVQVNEYDPDAYIYQYVRDVSGEVCDLQDILDGVWLTIVTLTSVGYGRFYPRNIAGQILSILVAIVGAFYMAMPLAIVGTTFYSAYKRKEEARARIHVKRKFKHAVDTVRSYIRQGKLDTISSKSSKQIEAQAGLYREEEKILGDFIDILGPINLFEPDGPTINNLRTKHTIVMNILGHVLVISELDALASKGMFG